MKKIIIFIPSLAGGGAERTIVNIIKYLDKNLFQVKLVLVKHLRKYYQENKYEELIRDSCEIIYINRKLSIKSLPYIIFDLSRIIKKESPDLLFSTRFKSNVMMYAAKCIARFKGPIVLRESTNRTEEGINTIEKLLISYAYNRANGVIALSNGVANDLRHNFKIENDKIRVIYNPVDTDEIIKLSNLPVEKKDQHLFSKDTISIISVGRLFDQKDHQTLLKAFKLVAERYPVQLLILGQGPLESELKSLSEKLCINDKVHFLGFKKNPYVYMKCSDLFVLSSKFEGFGHVLVEAMVVKTPVISSNCPSGPEEVLCGGEYGELFPVGNYEDLAKKIMRMLEDKHRSNQLVEKSSSRVNDFKANKIVQEYQDYFIEFMK